jgi:DNA-binding LacI/PurR family transcriptional regulator
VPQDVSVTGFDNVKLSEFCYPALATVHIPSQRIGRSICDRLIPRPTQLSTNEHEIVIDPELVMRDSTRAAPAESQR